MADTILIRDSFDTLALDVDIAGRVPPLTESGNAWLRESAIVSGDGAGNVKFAAGNAVIKTKSLAESVVAVKVTWNDGGADNGLQVWVGDYSSSLIYPYRAYVARFFPRQNAVKYYRIDNYNFTQLGPDVTTAPWAALGADNIFVLQRNGNDFTGQVNGVAVGGFTDATYAPDGTRRYHGVQPLMTNQDGRLRIFEVFDSVSLTPASGATYTIVEVF